MLQASMGKCGREEAVVFWSSLPYPWAGQLLMGDVVPNLLQHRATCRCVPLHEPVLLARHSLFLLC